MSKLPGIIVITGPTATGKSDLAVRLASEIDGEIISADSMQLYKGMDIGTAKPTHKEMHGIPHHLIDIVSPFENYSVARYVNDASECIHDILLRDKKPIVVGGTGLYIDSLIVGREFSVRGDENQRKELEDEFDSAGGDYMLKKLHEVDSKSAGKLHPNDKKRIIRALETFYTTGKTISLHDIESKAKKPRYQAIKFALNFEQREDLYSRIDARVDNMINNGLEKEVRVLLEMGLSNKNTSMQAIGYKEILNAISSGEEIFTAVEKIKMESRRYAKRQLTWLRRDKSIKWIVWNETPDFDCGVSKMLKILRSVE